MVLIDAVSYSDYRLPEAFSGYNTGYGGFLGLKAFGTRGDKEAIGHKGYVWLAR